MIEHLLCVGHWLGAEDILMKLTATALTLLELSLVELRGKGGGEEGGRSLAPAHWGPAPPPWPRPLPQFLGAPRVQEEEPSLPLLTTGGCTGESSKHTTDWLGQSFISATAAAAAALGLTVSPDFCASSHHHAADPWMPAGSYRGVPPFPRLLPSSCCLPVPQAWRTRDHNEP